MTRSFTLPDYIHGFDIDDCKFSVAVKDLCEKNRNFLQKLPNPSDFDIVLFNGLKSLHQHDKEELFNWWIEELNGREYLYVSHKDGDIYGVLSLISDLVCGRSHFSLIR